MYTIKFDSKEAMRMLNNVVAYSDGFIKETKAKQSTIASKLADTSIQAFYDYLDGLGRTNPGMLHHVYEWGNVGNPEARLVELKKALGRGKSVSIDTEFLASTSIPPNSNEPFYEKATIMEEGIPITIQATDAKAMFFEYNGEEYFTAGPITIENPGGEAVRGSFLRAFEEFYNIYFDQVYLRAIKFYDHFSETRGYANNFPAAVKSANAAAVGRTTALKWIMSMPGEDV